MVKVVYVIRGENAWEQYRNLMRLAELGFIEFSRVRVEETRVPCRGVVGRGSRA